MSEFDEKLNTLLNDPNAMAQVMSLAQSLSGRMDGGADGENGSAPPPPPPSADGGMPDAAALLSSLSGLDTELVRRLLKQMNRPESAETTTLLRALRPFLSEARRDKVDRAAQLARLIHAARAFFSQEA